MGVTVFGFISQTVQFLVAAPVSRQQLGLLITAAGLQVGERGRKKREKTAKETGMKRGKMAGVRGQ